MHAIRRWPALEGAVRLAAAQRPPPQARPAGWQGVQRGPPHRRLLDGRWHGQPGADIVREFLRLLAICHTVIPEGGATPDTIRYQARPRAPPCLTPVLPMRRGHVGRSLYS